jgi:hypothetical protein
MCVDADLVGDRLDRLRRFDGVVRQDAVEAVS